MRSACDVVGLGVTILISSRGLADDVVQVVTVLISLVVQLGGFTAVGDVTRVVDLTGIALTGIAFAFSGIAEEALGRGVVHDGGRLHNIVRTDVSTVLVTHSVLVSCFAGGIQWPVVGVASAAAPHCSEGTMRALVQHMFEVGDESADCSMTVCPFYQFSQVIR